MNNLDEQFLEDYNNYQNEFFDIDFKTNIKYIEGEINLDLGRVRLKQAVVPIIHVKKSNEKSNVKALI